MAPIREGVVISGCMTACRWCFLLSVEATGEIEMHPNAPVRG
jgi:hypothetical protein